MTRLRLDQALEGEIQPSDLGDLAPMKKEAIRHIWDNPGRDPAAALRRVETATAQLAKQLKNTRTGGTANG